MSIKRIHHENTNVFGFEIIEKLTTNEIDNFLPSMEKAIEDSNGKLRLLINVTKMKNADIKSEWETFEFLRKHVHDIQIIAIVGAHSWEKVMSEIISESIFAETPTLYFKPEDIENAWGFLMKAPPPKYVHVSKYVESNKGLFTKHGSPHYI
ncbi:MAG: STAS/SEC14 domain-containing protein [Candidatus Aceula lacicola]|nr:STAS/SEC14 domain-containing protein [Candidatus Aceula lacicola]